jgi:hypothetical protein
LLGIAFGVGFGFAAPKSNAAPARIDTLMKILARSIPTSLRPHECGVVSAEENAPEPGSLGFCAPAEERAKLAKSFSPLRFGELRGKDLNLRPPGYEFDLVVFAYVQ